MDFRLPELGEGIADATVVAVAVKAGERVKSGQTIVEVETDKASVPVPAPSDGTVSEVRVKPGDKIKVGQVIAVLGDGAAEAKKAKPEPSNKGEPQRAPTPKAKEPKEEAQAEQRPTEEKKKEAPEAPPQPKESKAPAAQPPAPEGNGRQESAQPIPAGPATRRLARELGVSLREIRGSARGGRVTIDDVKAYVKRRITQPGGDGLGAPPLPDFSKYGPVEKRPISNLRRKIAENLTIAWHTAPAVTQFDLADITELEAGRKRATENLPKGASKITMTVLAVRAVVAALREFPHFASSLDLAAGVQVFKQYFHIGIAVDTERGLVVPVIRDADKKNLRDLAAEIAAVAEKARGGKLTIDEMRGGVFTITNLGGIGGTAFSPIINYPEVAILGLARSSLQPVVRDGKIEPRLMLPLCLSYDHRVIDGADAARFTTRLAQLFSDPIRLLMES
jgi:pyruvate dehydrogenase E2 component (dihydrolipoamide acetyltransferase)